ncbi:MAG: hypothetical protein ACI36Y_08700, partial [Coriobacteriales bacterium]
RAEVNAPGCYPLRAKLICKYSVKRKKTIEVYGTDGELAYLVEAAGFLSKRSASIARPDGSYAGSISCSFGSSGYWESYSLSLEGSPSLQLRNLPPSSIRESVTGADPVIEPMGWRVDRSQELGLFKARLTACTEAGEALLCATAAENALGDSEVVIDLARREDLPVGILLGIKLSRVLEQD